VTGVWSDDAPSDARRESAINRMMELCPKAYRVAFRPMVAMAIGQASDEQISSLADDIDRVRALADAGDIGGVANIARKYGATDAQINTYLPMFAAMK